MKTCSSLILNILQGLDKSYENLGSKTDFATRWQVEECIRDNPEYIANFIVTFGDEMRLDALERLGVTPGSNNTVNMPVKSLHALAALPFVELIKLNELIYSNV